MHTYVPGCMWFCWDPESGTLWVPMVSCLSEERQPPEGKKRDYSPDGSLEWPGKHDPGVSGLDRDTLPSLLKAQSHLREAPSAGITVAWQPC